MASNSKKIINTQGFVKNLFCKKASLGTLNKLSLKTYYKDFTVELMYKAMKKMLDEIILSVYFYVSNKVLKHCVLLTYEKERSEENLKFVVIDLVLKIFNQVEEEANFFMKNKEDIKNKIHREKRQKFLYHFERFRQIYTKTTTFTE